METMFDAVDLRYLLIENYKKMKLDEKQLIVILMIDHLLRQNNNLITAEHLSLKMSLSVEEIDAILVDLINRNIVEYDNSGNEMKTTLNPLKRWLYRDFQLSVVRSSEENKRDEFAQKVTNIYTIFEKELGRTLSPLEFGRIREWISFGYTDQMIIKALHEALVSKKKSIRSIDKILLKLTTRDDVAKEGYSAVSEQWEKDIEKTIAIAKTRWLDDDK
jgi:DNA replication protein